MKVQTLGLDSEIADDAEKQSDKTMGFWRRQFSAEPSRKQRIFDWAYGVVIPTACVVLDPIVFKTGFVGRPLLSDFRPFAYLLSATSILVMVAWLLWGKRLSGFCAPVSGLFISGSLVSALVGIVLLPFSAFGVLFFGLGLLGFTPLFAALVYLRNGVRAYRSVPHTDGAFYAAILAGLFSLVVPYVANAEIDRSLSRLLRGDEATIRRETTKLSLVWPLADFRPIASEYFIVDGETDESRKNELKSAYEKLTGERLDTDAPVLMD